MRITILREEARGEKVVNWLRKQRKILSDHQVHQRGGKLPWPLFSLFRALKHYISWTMLLRKRFDLQQ